MTSHNVADKKLWHISWPLLIEFLLIMPGPALDAYFLSKVSDTAAAAVSVVAPFFMISVLIIQSLNQGGMSVAAQQLGARDTKNVSATFLVMMIIDIIACTLIGIFFVVLHRPLAGLVGLSGAMQDYGGEFLSVIGTLIIFLGIRLVYASITAVYGKTLYNLISATIMVMVNVVFNIIFIYGLFGFPKMLVMGVASATVLGWFASVLYNMYIVHRVLGISFPWRGIMARFKSLARPILNIGMPSMLEPVSYHTTQLIYGRIVVAIGVTEVVARGYLSNVLTVVLAVPMALGIGTQILVGHFIGAKRFDDADRQVRSSVMQGMITSASLVTVLYIFSDQVIGIFTTDKHVLELGTNVFLIAILLEIARPVNIVVGNSLRVSGDARYTSLMGAAVMFLFSVPLVYTLGLPLHWGLIGVWFGMAVDEIVRAILNFRRWNKRYWEKTGIAVQPHQEDTFAEKIR
jgi:putative MATE family efflux protein